MQRDNEWHDQAVLSEQGLCDVVTRTFANLPHAFSIISVPDYRFIYANRAQLEAMRHFGVGSLVDILGKHPWEIWLACKDVMLPLYEEACSTSRTQIVRNTPCEDPIHITYWDIIVLPNCSEGIDEVSSISIVGINVTERHQAEQALEKSEERYRHIVETALEGVWVLDSHARTEYVNDRMAEMLGYRVDEMLGGVLYDFISDPDRPEAEALWVRRKQRTAEQHDFRFRRKDGSELWTLVVATPVFDDRDQFAGAFAMVTDITERRRAEESMRASQGMLQSVMDNIPQSIFWKDRNSVYLGCNTIFAKQAGIDDPPEIVGKTDYDLSYTKEEANSYRAYDNKVMQTNTPQYHIIETQLQADGRRAWLDTNKVPLHDSEGNVVGILGTYEDITERKRAEEDLLRFRATLDAATEGIGVTDPEGNLVYANEALERMLGYSVEELAQAGVGIAHADPAVFSEEILPELKSGCIWEGEPEMRRKDGTRLVAEMHAAPVFGGDGSLVGLMAIFTDITERKQAEEDRENLLMRIDQEKHRAEDLASRLQRERDALQIIMDSTAVMIAYLDSDFNFVMVNQACIEAASYTREELIGRNLFDLFTGTGSETVFNRVRETGKAIEFEAAPYELLNQPWRGVMYWDWRLTPVMDEAGCVRNLVLSMVDVTERVRAKNYSDALNKINAVIGTTLDFNEIMRRLVIEGAYGMGSESAVVIMREADRWVPRHVHGALEGVLGLSYSAEDMPYAARAARTREPVVVDDVGDEDTAQSQLLRTAGVRSILILPLMIRGDVVGVLAFVYQTRAVAFSEAQIDFASKLGTSISFALSNARSYEAERAAVAREASARDAAQRQFALLQRALIPAQPWIGSGYNVAATYIAAFAGQEIGGDFYDVFRTQSGEVGILIGDVAGKDIEAAALAAAARNTVRSFAYETSSPEQALTRASAVLHSEQPMFGTFATVFLAILDLATGGICYSTAGHPPPAIYRCNGCIEFMALGAPPIGLMDGQEFKPVFDHLAPGDKLVMYTDGITEARHGIDMFEEEGIERTLTQCGRQSPEDIVSALLTAAREWSADHLTDDIAVLVVEREA